MRKAANQMEYKTTGIRYLVQEGGKNLSWSEESGVRLMEQDGLYFKDLADTGGLRPGALYRRMWKPVRLWLRPALFSRDWGY